MSEKQVEQLYGVLNESAAFLQKNEELSYIDSLIQTISLIQDEDYDGYEQLSEIKSNLDLSKFSSEDIRKAIQMAILTAIRIDNIQPTYQLTPDTIGDIIAYLISVIYQNTEKLSILDPALGTANLIETVYYQLKQANPKMQIDLSGIENDDAMFELAAQSLEIQKLSSDLVHEDYIQDVVIPKVDVIVSDLPVGYYPIDENVTNFETKANTGHSYVHHLLIEKSMDNLKDGGFGFFLVPSQLFQTTEAKGLLKWMQGNVYLQGMLNLPAEIFKNKKSQKSILILQKNGNGINQADPIMLGEFPSFKKQDDFKKFLDEISAWEKHELKLIK